MCLLLVIWYYLYYVVLVFSCFYLLFYSYKLSMHVYLLEIILLASHNVLFFNYIHVFIVVLLLTVQEVFSLILDTLNVLCSQNKV